MNNNLKFYEWLGGLIDADGGFYVSKPSEKQKSYGSIEITMHSKEIQTLYLIKTYCQGQVTPRIGVNAVRWRLHKREPLIELLNKISGNIHVERRQIQFKKICQLYNIEYKTPNVLTYDNAWFSGFFSGEGSIYVNKTNFMAVLSVSQKENNILKEIQHIYKGNIHFDISWNGWIWQCNNFNCDYILNYFQNNPLYNPYKQAKIRGFKRFLFFKRNNYHLDSTKKKRLLHYINLLNTINNRND